MWFYSLFLLSIHIFYPLLFDWIDLFILRFRIMPNDTHNTGNRPKSKNKIHLNYICNHTFNNAIVGMKRKKIRMKELRLKIFNCNKKVKGLN